jgi:hypothetical protein
MSEQHSLLHRALRLGDGIYGINRLMLAYFFGVFAFIAFIPTIYYAIMCSNPNISFSCNITILAISSISMCIFLLLFFLMYYLHKNYY